MQGEGQIPGGLLVMKSGGGGIVYSHLETFFGDHPPIADVGPVLPSEGPHPHPRALASQSESRGTCDERRGEGAMGICDVCIGAEDTEVARHAELLTQHGACQGLLILKTSKLSRHSVTSAQ